MEESGLEFNAEVIQNQGETYSSLTDINGVPIFTQEFAEKIKQKQSEHEERVKVLSQEVFVEPMHVQENSMDMLFMGTTQQVLKQENIASSTSNSLLYPLIGVWVLVFFGVMAWYCQRRNRKTEKKKKEIEENYVLQ